MYSANHQWSRRSWAPEDNSSVTDTCIVACQDSSRGPSRASPGSWVLGQASRYVYWVITQQWNQYVWRAPSSRVALSLSRAAFARRFYFQWSRLTSQTFGHCFKFFYWFFVSFTSCISIPLISLTLPTFLPYPTPQKKKKKINAGFSEDHESKFESLWASWCLTNENTPYQHTHLYREELLLNGFCSVAFPRWKKSCGIIKRNKFKTNSN